MGFFVGDICGMAESPDGAILRLSSDGPGVGADVADFLEEAHFFISCKLDDDVVILIALLDLATGLTDFLQDFFRG
jgi:hypothetical protein